jgi:hypothetical protein
MLGSAPASSRTVTASVLRTRTAACMALLSAVLPSCMELTCAPCFSSSCTTAAQLELLLAAECRAASLQPGSDSAELPGNARKISTVSARQEES